MKRVCVSKVRMPRSQSMTLGLPAFEDVLGRQQQFFDRGAGTALEQHRLDRTRRRLPAGDSSACCGRRSAARRHSGRRARHVLAGHHFGDDGQAGLGPGGGEHFQPVFLETLKAIGAGARLEGAAAQGRRAGGLDGAGRGSAICSSLSTEQGPAITPNVCVADREAAGADHGRLGLELRGWRPCRERGSARPRPRPARSPAILVRSCGRRRWRRSTVRSVPTIDGPSGPSASTRSTMCSIFGAAGVFFHDDDHGDIFAKLRKNTRPGTVHQENCKVRGLVHFSANQTRIYGKAQAENMDLSPLRWTLQFSWPPARREPLDCRSNCPGFAPQNNFRIAIPRTQIIAIICLTTKPGHFRATKRPGTRPDTRGQQTRHTSFARDSRLHVVFIFILSRSLCPITVICALHYYCPLSRLRYSAGRGEG